MKPRFRVSYLAPAWQPHLKEIAVKVPRNALIGFNNLSGFLDGGNRGAVEVAPKLYRLGVLALPAAAIFLDLIIGGHVIGSKPPPSADSATVAKGKVRRLALSPALVFRQSASFPKQIIWL